MKPEELEKMPLQVEKMFYDLQKRVMEDVIRRIKKTGEITSTADYQIEKLIMMGQSSEFIEAEIKRLTQLTDAEIYQLYEDVIDKEYTRNKTIYEQVNANFIPYEESQEMQAWVSAIVAQTKADIKNITQSMGFALKLNGKIIFTPFAEYYQKYLDRACMDIITGTFSYNTVLRRVIKEMTSSGIRTVDYASGHSNRITVAARRAVMTGVNQLCGQINQMNADKLGTDTYEVPWHAGARPSHWWGGMIFTMQELIDICGLGTGEGIGGWNCYHPYYAFVPGISVRQYTDDQLAELNAKEKVEREWKGKKYNAYNASQKQRQMETAMRAQREKVYLLQKGGADPDEIMIAKAKYQGQLNEYSRFCKKMKLPEDRERIYLDLRGKVATNTKLQNAKYTKEMIKNADKDTKQYYRYRNILGNEAGSLAGFRQMKYNNPKKFEDLKKKTDTYSEIDKKDWSPEFKRKSREAYARFEKEGIYMSVHALGRLYRMNKPGVPEVTEKELIEFIKGPLKYKEGEKKLIYFDAERQLVVVKNKETGDIVSIVRRKNPKEVWESV